MMSGSIEKSKAEERKVQLGKASLAFKTLQLGQLESCNEALDSAEMLRSRLEENG